MENEIDALRQYNGLSPAEAERLFYLLEELGEAQQAIGKTLRHGYESRDPTKGRNMSATNREALEREIGDVQRAVCMLCEAGDLRESRINAVVARGKPLEYMHHQ